MLTHVLVHLGGRAPLESGCQCCAVSSHFSVLGTHFGDSLCHKDLQAVWTRRCSLLTRFTRDEYILQRLSVLMLQARTKSVSSSFFSCTLQYFEVSVILTITVLAFDCTVTLPVVIAGLQLPGMDCCSAASLWRSHCRHGGQIRRQHPQELCQRPISHLHSHGSHAPVWAVSVHLLPVWCGRGAAVCLHVWQVHAIQLWRL